VAKRLFLKNDIQYSSFYRLKRSSVKTQDDYYQALSESDKSGKSTIFIEYMLRIIDDSLANLLNVTGQTLTSEQRIAHFISLGKK